MECPQFTHVQIKIEAVWDYLPPFPLFFIHIKHPLAELPANKLTYLPIEQQGCRKVVYEAARRGWGME